MQKNIAQIRVHKRRPIKRGLRCVLVATQSTKFKLASRKKPNPKRSWTHVHEDIALIIMFT